MKKIIKKSLLITSALISFASINILGAGKSDDYKGLKPDVDFYNKQLTGWGDHLQDDGKAIIIQAINAGVHPDKLIRQYTEHCYEPILHTFVPNNDLEFVEYLLKNNADANILRHNYPPLLKASTCAMAQLLLNHQANVLLENDLIWKVVSTNGFEPGLIPLYTSRGASLQSDLNLLSKLIDAEDSPLLSRESHDEIQKKAKYLVEVGAPLGIIKKSDVPDYNTMTIKEQIKHLVDKHRGKARIQERLSQIYLGMRNTIFQRDALMETHLPPGLVDTVYEYSGLQSKEDRDEFCY